MTYASRVLHFSAFILSVLNNEALVEKFAKVENYVKFGAGKGGLVLFHGVWISNLKNKHCPIRTILLCTVTIQMGM